MGNPFSIPCDPCINKVFHCLDEKVAYTHNLEKNLTALETTMEDLKAKQDDLSRRVKREEDRGLQRLAGFQVWFDRVETTKKKVNGLLSARNVQLQKLCLCGFCSKSLTSSYRFGKKVVETLREAEKLKSEVFEVIAEEAQTSAVEERPLQPIIVGQETMLEKAWKHLMDDGVGIMGFYGMGGVGKTTLLTQLINKFSQKRGGFDFVIWVVVSKELQIEKILDEIAQKVGLYGEEWKQKRDSQKVVVIYNFLKRKRFVLFLDDIWEKVDLAEIGVPYPTTENKCKVAFTTRSQDVCASMGVQNPMEVQCLAENEAFDLFQKKVGQTTLGSDPEIPDLAKTVARKCCGLPLALNVIGETMSSKRKVEEWKDAIEVLTLYALEFKGMKDKIFPFLKYSYDNLEGEHFKSCLLYCALFPEDYKIPKKKLIDYWTGEGIINVSGGIERGENKGYEIIGTLVRSSLLMEEVVVWNGTERVHMHDVVREMALWIASDLGNQKEAFVSLDKMSKVENWSVVRKMSLMQTKIQHLDGSPECRELTTLLLREANLEKISSEFFNSMPKLVVLDLSRNSTLNELPDGISELASLQYLDLSFTGIRLLPMGLLELKNLIHLDLYATRKLSSIDGISNLQNLKVLKFNDFAWDFAWDPKTLMEELKSLEHLEALTIGISRLPFLEQYLSSLRLTSCTRVLEIERIDVESSGISLPVTMEKKLRVFRIWYCSISEIKMVSLVHNPRTACFSSLSSVSIIECKFLKELTLLMFAPNLKILGVGGADELEDIINKEKACECGESGIVPFPKLFSLKLFDLPNLNNIYWSPLPFPCLKSIEVHGCPKLKYLPLDSQSSKHGLIITYDRKEWIEGVEWEDEATKTRFLASSEQL